MTFSDFLRSFPDFLITFSGIFHDFLGTFPSLSCDILRTFLGLSLDFPRNFLEFSENFLSTLSGLSHMGLKEPGNVHDFTERHYILTGHVQEKSN